VSTVNVLAREVSAKIVFYGPGLSGKTTTLRRIYDSVRPAHRGDMMSLATEGDRTLFFDFLPVKVERVGDCAVRLALYTVPGQVFYNATRKLVLQGADGVVFVADSQPTAMDSNRESLQNLEDNLLDQGIRLERFPLVFQWNKRDLASALPVAEMRAALNPRGAPEIETCATTGQGIFEGLKAITRLVIKDLRTKRIVPSPPVRAGPPGGRVGLEDQLRAHLRPPGGADRPAGLRVAARGGAAVAMAQDPDPAAQLTPAAGPLTVLAPPPLAEHARAAEAAFAQGDFIPCVKAVQEAVRQALAFTGEASPAAQAYFLKVDGNDLLRLSSIGNKAVLTVEDAAFALFVAMETFARVNAAGLSGEP
jgi:signal recognition particle receptor subunit beta